MVPVLWSPHICLHASKHTRTHTYINIQKIKEEKTQQKKMGREEEGIGQRRSGWERGQSGITCCLELEESRERPR